MSGADDGTVPVRYMPLYVATTEVKLEKQPAPAVQTLSVQRGFKVAEWCQNIIAWLRGRGLLTFFLAAVTGRAVLLTDGDDEMGVTEETLCLDRWLRRARDHCAGGHGVSMLTGASPLKQEAEWFAERHPIRSVMLCGKAEVCGSLDNVIFTSVRSTASTEVRQRLMDVNREAGRMGIPTLVVMHNTAFAGIREEDVLEERRAAFDKPKARDMTAQQHHEKKTCQKMPWRAGDEI